MKGLITGATGLLGTRLLKALQKSSEFDEIHVLSRNPREANESLRQRHTLDIKTFPWDPENAPPALESLEGVDAVFHLAGEPLAQGRWTKNKKQAIYSSRVEGTKKLVSALKSLASPPSVLISASAVGFYGDRGDEKLQESSPADPESSFLSQVCGAWEHQALEAQEAGVRVVLSRTGVVLAPGGGALARMLPPFRKGLGGRLGSGHQWMPWIHIDDVMGLWLHALKAPRIRGPMNVSAPHPVTNRELTKTLGRVLGRPTFLPAPKLGLRLAFGELSTVLLASQRALPSVAQETGYTFRFPDLEPALEDIEAVASSSPSQ